ncbi:hypothetical protein [Amorphus sp. 3PC139-8]
MVHLKEDCLNKLFQELSDWEVQLKALEKEVGLEPLDPPAGPTP